MSKWNGQSLRVPKQLLTGAGHVRMLHMKIASRYLEQSRLVYYGAVFEIREKIPVKQDSLASDHNGGENLPA
jgi:hypothetical protein